MLQLVYYSGPSGYTHRFIQKLADSGFAPAADAMRLPLRAADPTPVLFGPVSGAAPYILVTPTYGGGSGRSSNHVPKRVVEFLNIAGNRERIVGVVGGGNKNFGPDFAAAAEIIAEKLGIPVLDTFEISGTREDINRINSRLEAL